MPYALREALAAFQRSPLLAGLSVAMIALSLLVVGLFGIAAYNVSRQIDRVEERVQVVAYLRDDATPEQIEAATAELRKNEAVREVLYTTREQALVIAKSRIPEFERLIGGLQFNPLPATLGIALHPHQSGPQVAQAVAQRVSEFDFVEDVDYGEDWLPKVYLLRRVAGAATAILGGAFAAVAALIIGAAVRIAVFARRDEISIMRLVGATDAFVRRPFVLEGFFAGIGGGILALLLTFAVYRILSRSLFKLEWLPETWVIGILVLATALGAMASAVAVRRHLREI
jgi:cell division transport system permease protein